MDDVNTLTLIVKGTEGLDNQRSANERLKGSIQTTADTYEVLERQVGEYEVLERRVTETTQTLVQAQATQINYLEKLGIQTQVVEAATARVGQSLGKQGHFGLGVQQASYAVQDFTSVMGTQGLGRAFASIQNNIPILLSSLGAGAGLAGILSIVSIGVGLLIDNWGKLTGAWNKGDTEKETERQKKLADAIEHTREAGEKLARTHPPEQREQEARIKRAVEEFGGPAVLQEIGEALKAGRGDFGAAANKQMAQTLFTNLMQGRQDAWQLLGDLPLRGPIGGVLRGGATPSEQAKIDQERALREAKELQDAQDRVKKEKETKAQKEKAEQKQREAQDERDMQEAERMKKQADAEAQKAREQASIARERAVGMQARRRGMPGLHEISEAGGLGALRAAKELQQGLAQEGQTIPLAQALRMIKDDQDRYARAEQRGVDAIFQMFSGTARRAEYWEMVARRAEAEAKRMMPTGANAATAN